MSIRCCKDCIPPKRHINCHSTCEQYLKESKQNQILLEYARLEKKKDYLRCKDKG